jgi:hypothetical protein
VNRQIDECNDDVELGCWVALWEGEGEGEGEGVEVMSERFQNKTALYLTKTETRRLENLTLKQIHPTLQQTWLCMWWQPSEGDPNELVCKLE